MDNLETGRQFKLGRKGRDINMIVVAEILGCSQSFISRFENGQREMSDEMKKEYRNFLTNYEI